MQHRFNLNELKDLLIQDGDKLFCFYRKYGAKCYPEFERALSQVEPGGVLIVVIPKEAIVDYSFIDETIGQLYAKLLKNETDDHYLVIEVSDPNQFDTVQASFVMRKLLGLVIEDGEPKLAGLRNDEKQRVELSDTLEHLKNSGRLTATELAKRSNLGLTAANNRLKRLFDAKLAKRVQNPDEPRQFIYINLLE